MNITQKSCTYFLSLKYFCRNTALFYLLFLWLSRSKFSKKITFSTYLINIAHLMEILTVEILLMNMAQRNCIFPARELFLF